MIALTRQKDHLAKRIMGLASKPGVAIIGNRRLAQTDPAHHAADEAVALGHGIEMVERAPAHQPEIADIGRDLDIRQLVQQGVEGGRTLDLEPPLARPDATLRVYDVNPFVHLRRQLAEKFRRILKVGIENENPVAATDFQTGAERDLVAVIAGKIDADDMRVGSSKASNGLAGSIA